MFAVVTAEALGPSLLAEVGVSVPPKAMVKVPPAASDWIRMRSVLLGSAMAVILIVMILGSVAIFGVLGLAARALIRRARRVDLAVEPA